MPENTQGKEGNKIPEKSILPVSKESVDKALGEITQDPTRAMSREQSLMKKQNPVLFTNLDDFGKILGNAGYFDFMGGACWTYKILRIQAETCGRELPQISPDLLLTYIRDHIQYGNEQSEKKEFVHFEEKVKKIATQDPEFGRAIKEFTKYRVTALSFYSGAIEVYDFVKNALHSEELAKKFNLEPTPEETIKQFLEKLPAERKLLSEEEKKEAAVTAREVREKAMEKAGGKDFVSLQNPDTNQEIRLYLGVKAQGLPGKDPGVDLVIKVINFIDPELPANIVHDYCFNPDGVEKTTYDLSATKPINFKKLLSIEDPKKRADIIARAKEQITEETYEPNKDELTVLLRNLSSAK